MFVVILHFYVKLNIDTVMIFNLILHFDQNRWRCHVANKYFNIQIAIKSEISSEGNGGVEAKRFKIFLIISIILLDRGLDTTTEYNWKFYFYFTIKITHYSLEKLIPLFTSNKLSNNKIIVVSFICVIQLCTKCQCY